MVRIIAVLLSIGFSSCMTEPQTVSYSELDIDSLQTMMVEGGLTSEQLTQFYLDRIESIDQNGPALNAIIEVNPEALEIARELDRERVISGVRGLMHGIPVVLKANIDTADQMETTAGSLAMAGHKAAVDSFMVAKLREAGAVILGKANLSEWANFRSTKSSSGWSSIGGQTKNPYALLRNPCGSSSGSAVAVAASLTSVAVGTETDGSVVCPASINGIVGIKPTLGFVSRSGIIPIAHSQDTAGPLGRTVKDAALLMNAMVGRDADDLMMGSYPVEVPDFAAELTNEALKSVRLGVIRNYRGAGNDARLDEIFDESIQRLQSLGAQIVDDIDIGIEGLRDLEFEVLLYEFRTGLNDYLKNSTAPVKSLEEVIEFNKANADRVMPIFQQEILEMAQAKGPLTENKYLVALAESKRIAQSGINSTMRKHNLDALIAPTQSLAWVTDHVNGDVRGISSSVYAAVSGYPSISVPAGYISGLPIGISIIGKEFDDAKLIRYAYAYEQATKVRRPPPIE